MARDRAFWLTALAVAGIFVFALFVRSYWYADQVAPPQNFVLPESDSYYQHRSVERIQADDWQHPVSDPLLNYPLGGVNPNPPLWDWWLAAWGAMVSPFFAGDAANHPIACPADAPVSQQVCVSTWWVTEFSPALFGALTVLVIIFLGREVWGWRAGLLAGFFAATSTSHIESSFFGNARHYAFYLFFIVLCFYFFVKALNRAREQKWVQEPTRFGSLVQGVGTYARAHQLSLAYAAMAGLAMAGVALSWKGWPYVAGILFLFGLLQVIINQWRGRDSTHIFMTVGTALVVGLLVTLPYYANPALAAVSDTLLPVFFIVIAWVVVSVLFAMTRDLPFILVLPVALVLGLVAVAAAFIVAPSVAQSLLAPLVYFRQTKLYTTIAEAHPADFTTVIFGTGIVASFLALGALPYLFWVNRKTWRATWLFMAVWAAVAIFMAQSAVRFMFNATPVFALLAGWATSLILARLRFETISKSVAGLGGLSRDALKRAVNAWHIVGAVLLALLLIAPNVIFAVDAGTPPPVEDRLSREELKARGLPDTSANMETTFAGHTLGAFGSTFISDYWLNLFDWLATQDRELPEEKRPAFLSWWDYGHWAVSIGDHPTVADNFQNGFQFAGNFIVAQNETQAVQLFIARIADMTDRGTSRDVFLNAFTQAGLSAAEAQATFDQLATYQYAPALPLDKATAALKSVESATGHRIRYFAVDVRLFPYDNPQTPGIDFGSIFYAPVVLSDHNPDDYVETIIKTSQRIDGKLEFTAAEFTALQKDVRRLQQLQQAQPTQVYKYKEAFFNSMFYRAYLGTPVGLNAIPATDCAAAPQETFPLEGDRLPGIAMPGFCMEHFRLAYFHPQVRMLQYYPGATVTGTVMVDGQPLAGARVLAYDDAGDDLFASSSGLLTDAFKSNFQASHGRDIGPRDFDVPHAVTTTDAQGKFSLLAPFGNKTGVTIRAFKDDAEVGNRTLTISVAQAEQGASFTADIAGTSGTLAGKVFFDADRSRRFNEGDVALKGAKVSLDGDETKAVTTDDDGNFTFPGVPPGRHTVRATLQDYEMTQRVEESAANVQGGKTATFDVAMSLTRSAVSGTVWKDNNTNGALDGASEGVTNVPVKAFPDFRDATNTALAETGFSRDNGTLAFQATPGKYVVRGEWVDAADGQGYAFGTRIDIPRGGAPTTLATNATRLVAATPATLNLTLDHGGGNISGTTTSVLLLPTQAGAPAAERTAVNGTLTLWLVPGTYQVYAAATADGARFSLATPLTLVVGATPASAEGTLTRQG